MSKLIYCPNNIRDFIDSLDFPGETSISLGLHNGYSGSTGMTGYSGLTGPTGTTGYKDHIGSCVKPKIQWTQNYTEKQEYANPSEIMFTMNIKTPWISQKRQNTIEALTGKNHISYTNINKTEKLYPRLKKDVAEILEETQSKPEKIDKNNFLKRDGNDWDEYYVEYSTEPLESSDKNYLKDIVPSRYQTIPNEYTSTIIYLRYTLAELEDENIRDTLTTCVGLLA